MPSKYLFLGETESISITSGRKWINLPTLSESTRECYVSILDCIISAVDPEEGQVLDESPIFLRLNIPSMNYFSSDNNPPIMKKLIFTSAGNAFAPQTDAGVEILTNDNLKNIEITLTSEDAGVVPFSIFSMNVTLKIDYVDQQAMTQQYLSQKPRTL